MGIHRGAVLTMGMITDRLIANFTADDTPTTRCCARCRRGTAALGDFPCGLDGRCKCHD